MSLPASITLHEENSESNQELNCVVLHANPEKGKTLIDQLSRIQPKWKLKLLPSDHISWEKELAQLNPHVVFFELGKEINLSLKIVDQTRFNGNYFHLVLITAEPFLNQALQIGVFGCLSPQFQTQELSHICNRINCVFPIQKQVNNESKLTSNQLMIQTSDGFKPLNIKSVEYLKADGCYTNIHTKQDNFLVTRRLKDYNFLQRKGFFRPHRSYIINLDYIHSYVKSDGGYIQMSDGEIISLSRDKKNDFFQLFLGS